ncbi:MAG TPA: flagellar biosynthetic protein FliR [Bryobacteraceae bacterium]|nr:flagellar biosynthetic protein FliR [Bryobacteraceae bacterium]
MNLGLPVSTMLAFLYVLARVSGLIVFLPVPGFRSAPSIFRVILAVAFSIALFPSWPSPPDAIPTFGELTATAFSEAGFGLMVGLAVAFLTEGFQLAAQTFGVQAGYGFASTIDPSTQADSGVIQIMMALITGVLFFSTGIDHQVFRVLGTSFEKFPAGAWAPNALSLDGIVRLGGGMFVIGLRLAMPVIALLLLLDLALALLGRMQQQLNLLSLSFPVKMLATLAILAALAPVIVRVFESAGGHAMEALWRVVSP